jgi:hypothetical protein
MSTGVVGTVSNSSLTYTAGSAAKLLISWVSTSTGTISAGGVVVAGGASGSGNTQIYVAGGASITITSSAATITGIVSTLEENS